MDTRREGMGWIQGERGGMDTFKEGMEWIHEGRGQNGYMKREGMEWIPGERGDGMALGREIRYKKKVKKKSELTEPNIKTEGTYKTVK